MLEDLEKWMEPQNEMSRRARVARTDSGACSEVGTTARPRLVVRDVV